MSRSAEVDDDDDDEDQEEEEEEEEGAVTLTRPAPIADGARVEPHDLIP